MGVLDDAIREHLELKRAHGASEDELASQEAEALGPARRAPAAFEEPGDDDGPGPGETLRVEPMADVAPPPADLGEDPGPDGGRVAPVHDIDEDPLAPPPPVAGAPLEGSQVEPAPIEEPDEPHRRD